jgi:hypothetical protein
MDSVTLKRVMEEIWKSRRLVNPLRFVRWIEFKDYIYPYYKGRIY